MNYEEIALKAGVSKSTISRVINNHFSVKDETRMRVLQVIKELDIDIKKTQEDEVSKRSNTIAIFVRELTEQFYSDFIRHLHHYADLKHYGAIYIMRNRDMITNVDYIDVLSKKVDGFIFMGDDTISKEELKYLVSINVPVVVMEMQFDVKGITYITVDNYEATRQAVQHLVDLGHKKIINITAPEDIQEMSERNKAYLDVLNENGLKYRKKVLTDFTMDNAERIGREIASEIKYDNVTAAFCSNDIIAAGFIKGLKSRGIYVPRDFSVVGFDEMSTHNAFPLNIPQITSVKQPQGEMAKYGVEALINLIENHHQDYSKIFNCELKVHESTMKLQ